MQPAGQDHTFEETLGELQSKLEDAIEEDNSIIIGGDWNTTSNSSAKRKRILSNFIEELGLKVHKAEHDTYHHFGLKVSSNLDYFLQGVPEIVRSLALGYSDTLPFCNRILNREQAAALLMSALPH